MWTIVSLSEPPFSVECSLPRDGSFKHVRIDAEVLTGVDMTMDRHA